MRSFHTLPLVAALLFAAACDRQPTQPFNDTAAIDSIDSAILTFNATYGLPDGPLMGAGAGNLGGMSNATAGAAFPAELRLSDAQKAAIKALREAFATARKADIAKLGALHKAARAAYDAGKRGKDLQPYIDAAKATRTTLKAALDALHTAIWNVLTPAQQAWVSAHKPTGP